MVTLLSDEELRAVATEYVRLQYGPSFEAVPCRTYVTPDGVYFTPFCREADVFPLGDGGLFVSRQGGEVCHFGSGHAVEKGIDYWLSRFAEGWRPGFYLLSLEPVRDRKRLVRLLHSQVGVRVRAVSGGSMWIWAQRLDKAAFLEHLRSATAVLLRAEAFDALRVELARGVLIGCRFVHLGEFRLFESSELSFLDRVQPVEFNVPTRGDFWIYLPADLERRVTDIA